MVRKKSGKPNWPKHGSWSLDLKELNKSSTVALADGNNSMRIRMVVAQTGEPKLEFLDANGKVIQSLPDSSQK